MRPRLRWVMIGLVFLATLINFIDRFTVSTLAPLIVRDLRLSNQQYAAIASWFLVAYSISHALSGRLYDRVGVKRGFSYSITLWSLAAMAHAMARTAGALSLFRFLLGLGEAGNWPGAAKVCAEWFPVKERTFAMSIFNSGAALGSVIATPIIVALQLRFGWQATFLITGGLGFGWLLLWLLVYRPPTARERASLGVAEAAHAERTPWRDLAGHKEVWGIVLGRFFTDPAWWLFLNWLPLYLNRVHGMDLQSIAWAAPVPFLVSDIGSLMGGGSAAFLLGRGWSIDKTRKTLIVIGAACMAGGMGVLTANSVYAALAWMSLAAFGFQFWVNNVQTLPSDYFPPESVGSVAGMGGLGAGVGALLFTLSTGWLVDNFGYTPVLVLAAGLPVIGSVLLLALGGTIRPLSK
ncbi:MAG: MFS transporter [Bryobacterales bacterium]|nr:MFS transporter [Bryobacterales bacterium]